MGFDESLGKFFQKPFWKSFGKSLVVYIVVYFIFFIVLQASAPTTFFRGSNHTLLFADTNLLLMPPGYYIFFIIAMNLNFSIGWMIILVVASILPNLIAAITAGRVSETKKQAFTSWMLVMILISIILTVIFLINPFLAEWSFYNQTATPGIINSFFYFIETEATNQIFVILWIFVFEILTGLFYSGFAVIFVKRNSLKEIR